MASKLEVTGEVRLAPSSPTQPGGEYKTVSLDTLARNYAAQDGGALAVTGTLLSPYQLSPAGVTAIRFVALRALDGQAMLALVSSSTGGTDQKVPFSDLLVQHAPAPGDPITSVKLVGSGRVEYVVAGD